MQIVLIFLVFCVTPVIGGGGVHPSRYVPPALTRPMGSFDSLLPATSGEVMAGQ
jgi:hypothetical protein